MFDAYLPYVIGFFIVAAVGIGLSVATLVTLAQESRRSARSVVPISAAHPAVAPATRRAA